MRSCALSVGILIFDGFGRGLGHQAQCHKKDFESEI